MSNNRKLFAGVVAAAALAASATFVHAQPQGGPGYGPGACAQGTTCPQGAGPRSGYGPGMMGNGPGAGYGPGMMGQGSPRNGGFGPGHMWSNPKAGVEGYLASLKVELKIAPNQEKAWTAFADKARAQSETMIARHEKFRTQAQANQNVPAPELLAQRTERMKEGLANMEAMTVAVKDLYGALTPEQKATADQLLARGPMGGFGGGRGNGGRFNHFHRPSGAPGAAGE